MAFPLTQKELEKELKTLLSAGLSGNADDFYHWVRMEIQKKFKDEPKLSCEQVVNFLESLKQAGDLVPGRFDSREYYLAKGSGLEAKPVTQDSYTILGSLQYSPLQYVKSRLEYFLHRNKVAEEEIIDISIATMEAVENAVKYGDGNAIEVSYAIDASKTFTISLVNTIRDFNLEDDIRRGKFSSTATLMRGMMVMQKLFNYVDLDIIDEKRQARFTASRRLTNFSGE